MDTKDLERIGIYHDPDKMIQLTNCVPLIKYDRELFDDNIHDRVFSGEIIMSHGTFPWELPVSEFSKDNDLKTSLYKAAGADLQIFCTTHVLRNAISSISNPSREKLTTKFGFSDLDAFATPSGVITAAGYDTQPSGGGIVCLTGQEQARHLDLLSLSPERLNDLRRHVATDLFQLNDPRIICLALAFAWLPILYPFTKEYGKFSLWIVGQTGTGKSFIAKLLQNLYGHFPLASGGFLTWVSTANSLERQGFYFNYAMAVVDDYKAETCSRPDAIRLIQGYADGASRSRLNQDASNNAGRPFRGWILSTGEETPEQSPSARARMIVIDLPNRTKEFDIGDRCVQMAGDYSGLTADFVHHVLAGALGAEFAQLASEYKRYFYGRIQGEQNDVRINS